MQPTTEWKHQGRFLNFRRKAHKSLVGQEMRKKILLGTNNQTFISSWNLSMKKPVSDSKTSSSRPNFFTRTHFQSYGDFLMSESRLDLVKSSPDSFSKRFASVGPKSSRKRFWERKIRSIWENVKLHQRNLTFYDLSTFKMGFMEIFALNSLECLLSLCLSNFPPWIQHNILGPQQVSLGWRCESRSSRLIRT